MPGSALGAPFQRGDVFLTASGGVQEYSPTGALQQTIAQTSGATSLCFDPSGRHLILPGTGLFDSSGNLVPSSWASVTAASRCVADGFGHVYVSAGGPSGLQAYSITKYDIRGNVLRTFNVTDPEAHLLAIDLAPDECTLYYGSWGGVPGEAINRLDGCTNTQGPRFNSDPWVDDLRVLPNWQVLATDDPEALLFDVSGQEVRDYIPGGCPFCSGNGLRTLSLDPDGTSFWLCCTDLLSDSPLVSKIFRIDINSGRVLSAWAASGSPAIYGPPLLGDADVQGTVDSNPAGTAEAFTAVAGYSGQMTRVHMYIDSASTAGSVVVGVYADHNGHPGALQQQATISNLRPGSWNYADVRAIPVTAGQRYWLAVLVPKGDGKIRFRDAGSSGGRSETSAQTNLTALPPNWSATGTGWRSAPLSAYGS